MSGGRPTASSYSIYIPPRSTFSCLARIFPALRLLGSFYSRYSRRLLSSPSGLETSRYQLIEQTTKKLCCHLQVTTELFLVSTISAALTCRDAQLRQHAS